MLSEISNQVLVLIGVLGAAYLSYLATTYRFRTKPKDPANELFNYYDTLLKEAWQQSREKDKLIDKLEASLDKIQQELYETKQLLVETKAQLTAAVAHSTSVQQHIKDTRAVLDKQDGNV